MFYYVAIPLIALFLIKGFVVYQSKYFSVADFRGWHIFLSFGVIKALDRFAKKMLEQHNTKVFISPASGSILRFSDTAKKMKDHYSGRAIDIMLDGPATLHQAYIAATKSGFNAVGVYPFWKPKKGLHLAIRKPTHRNFSWADISRAPGIHNYVALEKGFYYG